MSWVLLAALTLLAAFAAVAVALRTRPSGRAELALTTTIVWNALLVAPIYALGLTNHLTRWTLAPLAFALFAAVLYVAGRREGTVAESARAIGRASLVIVTLPFDGIARARRAGSLVVLALLLSAFLVVYTAFTAWFAPAWRQWDSLWYHEPIIGWTLQNHGFAPVDLPGDLQKANGYPRVCEMSHLWFVIFTDRRLVELLPNLITPGLLYATYLLVRRFSRDVISAMGLACVVLLMPNTCYLLASTYIDIQVALFLVAGTHYATRPQLRIADAWLATACVTLAVGSKVLALPAACLLAAIALGRLFAAHGLRRASVTVAVSGFVLVTGMMAATYLRNWIHFKNPFWPDLQYDNPKLGIHLPFVSYNADPLDMNMPGKQFFELFTSVPYSAKGLGHRGQIYDYGFAVVFTVIPAGLVALVVVFGAALRDVAGRALGLVAWRSPQAWNAVWIAIPMLASVKLTPALWGGRYHIANVAVLLSLVAFATQRRPWPRVLEGLTVTACMMSLVVFYWTQPRWWMTPSELVTLARFPYPEREVTPASALSPTLDIHAGAAIAHDLGMARATRLKKGDIVVFDDRGFWPGLLWNDDYSNRVVYVPEGPDFLDKVNALGAAWVFCRSGDAVCAPFRGNPAWHEITPYSVEPGWGSVMERVR